jgi:hypothetical protein
MKKRITCVILTLVMIVSMLPTTLLSVSAATLKISTQPKSSYTSYGSTAKATVKAKGDGLKYTWYYNNSGSSKYKKTTVTKSTYSAKMTDSVNGRKVYCIIKDKKGKKVQSKTVTLRMQATITTDLKTGYAKSGEKVKVSVKAKGDGLKYAWYYKSVGSSKYKKSSVTKSYYSVTMSDKYDGIYVYCKVTDKYGKTDTSKKVALRQSATITTQPKDVVADENESVKVTVKAKGKDLKYAWYYASAESNKFKKSSIAKSTYTTTMTEARDGRKVYCIVTDKYGKTDKSKTVTLKMNAKVVLPTTYTVIFKDWDGTVLKTETVESGMSVTAPLEPSRFGYKFVGWDKEFDNVVSDIVVVAIYEQITKPTILVSNVTGSAGESVEVPIMIVNNPGVAGAKITMSYDESLILTSATSGEAFSYLQYTKPGKFMNPCNFTWDSESGMATEDGTILTLKFTVPSDAKKGDSFTLTCTSKLGYIYDEELNDIVFEIVTGKITIV